MSSEPLSETYKHPVAVKEFGSDPLFLSYCMLYCLSFPDSSLYVTTLDFWIVRVPLFSTSQVFFSTQSISLAELIPALFYKC